MPLPMPGCGRRPHAADRHHPTPLLHPPAMASLSSRRRICSSRTMCWRCRAMLSSMCTTWWCCAGRVWQVVTTLQNQTSSQRQDPGHTPYSTPLPSAACATLPPQCRASRTHPRRRLLALLQRGGCLRLRLKLLNLRASGRARPGSAPALPGNSCQWNTTLDGRHAQGTSHAAAASCNHGQPHPPPAC